MSQTKIGLLISPDLFFTSKVTGTAQALGLRVDAVDDLASAVTRLSAGNVACILLDLAAPRVSVAEFVAAMPTTARVPIIAFGSHVNVELLEAARSAGAEVMPRSQFAATLPDILQRHLRS
jgi:CheY-like chemotaxis protein